MTTDNISNVARDIEQRFVAGLKGLALTSDEAALVQRVTQRLAQYGMAAVGGTPDQQKMLKVFTDLELSTLTDLGVAKQFAAEQVARQALNDALAAAVSFALKALIGAAIAA